MSGPYYFAWCDEGTTFGVGVQVEDEAIFELEVAQIEGDFAMLTIEVANPRIGLLGPGRHQWCWVSWFDGVSVVALFHGRLVGVPERLTDEVVRLLFIARPSDYPARKEALAATLRVLPWSDPVFLVEGVGDPDTVIEARSALYHIDRTTLEVTVSDVLDGEDGLIDVSEAEHFYDAVEVTFGATPLRQVVGTATLTFTQAATGEVDLTAPLVAVFQAAGSPYPWPLVSSYTGDGLLSSWPAPNTSLSGGWSMAPDSTATLATAMQAESFAVRYIDKSDNTDVLGFDRPAQEIGGTSGLNLGFQGSPHDFFINWKNFDVVFTCSPIIADFKLSYAASRKRSEVVSFTVSADVQSILTDPAGAEIETLTLNSTLVDQPVDEGGAIPIGDPRRNAYIPTDRGQMSLQFLLLLARAKLRMRARAVKIKFEGTWAKFAETLSCRKNLLLHDRRLPAGEALGKIIGYRLVASGTGNNFCEATIGCSIGHGAVLPAADAGTDVYATAYAAGYTARTGAKVAILAGELHYDDLAGTYVVDDDAVELFNMTPETVINSLTVVDGPADQRGEILTAVEHPGQQAPVRITTQCTVTDGVHITEMTNVAGLLTGVQYVALGPGIGSQGSSEPVLGFLPPATFFTFDGAHGGTLSRAMQNTVTAQSNKGRFLTITNSDPAVSIGLVPDPIGTLGKHATVVNLDLVPVTGGDFQTLYTVAVDELVLPKTIDLEAAA
jgi:hypothetical protein